MLRSVRREPEPEYVSLTLLDEDEKGGFFAGFLR
jgi:hypothetical protein